MVKYSVENKVRDNTDFDWWYHRVLNIPKRLISKSRSNQNRYVWVGYKNEIKLPNTYEHDILPDKEAGNSIWQGAIDKYISKIKVALELMKKGEKPPPGYKKIIGHGIFVL